MKKGMMNSNKRLRVCFFPPNTFGSMKKTEDCDYRQCDVFIKSISISINERI